MADTPPAVRHALSDLVKVLRRRLAYLDSWREFAENADLSYLAFVGPLPEPEEAEGASEVEWGRAARSCAKRLRIAGRPDLAEQVLAFVDDSPDLLAALDSKDLALYRAEKQAECPVLERAIEQVEWLLEKKAVPAPSAPARLGGEQIPAKLLMNWAQILNSLDLPNDDTNRHLVRRLNSEHDGPLLFGGQGSQPKVNKAMLIEWWNGLEERFREIDERSRDKAATVDSIHEYGRSGIVVPEIGGSVKKRRSSRER